VVTTVASGNDKSETVVRRTVRSVQASNGVAVRRCVCAGRQTRKCQLRVLREPANVVRQREMRNVDNRQER